MLNRYSIAAIALVCLAAAPAAAQTAPSASLYGGLNVLRFEGIGGMGFTAGVSKDVGASGRFSIVGEAALSWYEFFNVTALQGGIAVKVFERGPAALAARALTGVELCCGEGDNTAYFSFEPGAQFTYGLSDRLDLLGGFSVRVVRFEGEIDNEKVVTLGIRFKL